jgi:histidine triad (HIT) family protein
MTADCVFCAILAGRQPASKVYEDDRVMAFMDIYPMRPGHVLVIPKVHAQYVQDLTPDIRSHLFETANRVGSVLRRSSLAPADVHFVINDGVHASQTVPHVHMHVLPRYKGDTLNLLGAVLRKPLQAVLGHSPRALLDARAAELKALLH